MVRPLHTESPAGHGMPFLLSSKYIYAHTWSQVNPNWLQDALKYAMTSGNSLDVVVEDLDLVVLPSYCPVSNLQFLGNVVECVVAKQFQAFLNDALSLAHSSPASALVLGRR